MESKTGAVGIKMIAEYTGLYTETHTAYAITPGKLDNVIFEIDKSRVLKKIFE